MQQPPPEAFEVADRLRLLLVADKPNHEMADPQLWERRRRQWATQVAAVLRKGEGRSAEAAIRILDWVFGDQGGADFRFVIESPKALGTKWDTVELRMARNGNGHGNGRGPPGRGLDPKELWDWADELQAEEAKGGLE